MYSESSAVLASMLVSLLIVFLIFLICRELVCWYWKINTAIRQRDELLKSLNEMKVLLESQSLYQAKILLELEKQNSYRKDINERG